MKSFGKQPSSTVLGERAFSTLEPEVQNGPLRGQGGDSGGDRQRECPWGRGRLRGRRPACRGHLPFATQKQLAGVLRPGSEPQGPSLIFTQPRSRRSSLEESRPVPMAAVGGPIILGLNILRIGQCDSFLVPLMLCLRNEN